MRARSLVPLACLLALAACTAREAPRRILALGDSYTIGAGVTESERWPVQLADGLEARDIPVVETRILARSGWTTRDLLTALGETELGARYDLVTVLIGANDQFRGVPPDAYRARLGEILARAATLAGGRAERVIAVSIPDHSVTPVGRRLGPEHIRSMLRRFNAIVREVADETGATWVDIGPVAARAGRDRSLLVADGLHPSGAMYAAWVEAIAPVAAAVLRDRRR